MKTPRIATPAPTANAVPASVSNAQAREALRRAGLIDAVNTAISGANNPTLTDAWEYSAVIERHSVLVNALAAQLVISDATVDALFISAAAITF